jgi:hypothetical protein
VFGLTLTEQQHNEAAVAAVALRGLVETEEQEVVVTVAQQATLHLRVLQILAAVVAAVTILEALTVVQVL